MPLFLFARSGNGSYYGEITSNGLLALGVVPPGGVPNTWSVLSTGLDPVNEEIQLRFDVIGNEISLTAWSAGTATPKRPQLSRRNDLVTEGGELGFLLIPNIRGGNESASGQLRYVFVRDRLSNVADMLAAALRQGSMEPAFDLNMDGIVSPEDRAYWVHQIQGTYFGDANLDGEFNSVDVVQVFQAGEFEDDVIGNSMRGRLVIGTETVSLVHRI